MARIDWMVIPNGKLFMNSRTEEFQDIVIGAIRLTTYKQIQEYVAQKYGTTVKTCWIAHVKASHGLTRGPAHNREGPERKYPCPSKCWDMIEDALRHFGIIK